MTALSSVSMALLQTPDAASIALYQKWLMIFSGLVAFSLLLNAIITFTSGMAARKILSEVRDLIKDLHSKASPVIHKTNEIITDLTPKIRTVSENMTQISYTVREKVDEVGETVSQVNRTVAEANARTRGQVDHVDRMVTTALDTTEDLANTVAHGIRIPIKQMAGVVAGLRVGFETLVEKFSPKNNRPPGY